MLSRVAFGSLLVYSPQGSSEASEQARQTCYQIKRAVPSYLDRVAERIAEVDALRDLFGPAVVIVPAPRSAPLTKGALWPAERICAAMLRRGLAGEVRPCLRRATAVPKSATSLPHLRPRARRHYDSMSVDAQLNLRPPQRIVVVDDVVTRGSTLLAACSRLADTFPDASVTAFAAERTMTNAEIVDMLEPTVGEIRIDAYGETFRDP